MGLESDAPYDTLAELGELAATAGALVVGRATQRKRDIDNATYIGSGKAEELSLTASALEADLLIFDDELSPVQTRNLETITGVRVIDRTALILDIFARHAQSREGKLQVELAQLKYELPRIFGQGKDLSRQFGAPLPGGPAKPSWKATSDGSGEGSMSWGKNSRRWKSSGASGGSGGKRKPWRGSPWWGIPTRGRAPCSTP